MVMYNYIHIDERERERERERENDDRFYLALFSALEQTQCVFVAGDSKHGPIYIYNVSK